jgi:hypothetical protein
MDQDEKEVMLWGEARISPIREGNPVFREIWRIAAAIAQPPAMPMVSEP